MRRASDDTDRLLTAFGALSISLGSRSPEESPQIGEVALRRSRRRDESFSCEDNITQVGCGQRVPMTRGCVVVRPRSITMLFCASIYFSLLRGISKRVGLGTVGLTRRAWQGVRRGWHITANLHSPATNEATEAVRFSAVF